MTHTDYNDFDNPFGDGRLRIQELEAKCYRLIEAKDQEERNHREVLRFLNEQAQEVRLKWYEAEAERDELTAQRDQAVSTAAWYKEQEERTQALLDEALAEATELADRLNEPRFVSVPCGACDGKGRRTRGKCSKCGGHGTIPSEVSGA